MRKRETHINVRTTLQEKTRFQSSARRCGLSLSEYLRKLACGYEPRAAPPIEYHELIRLLTDMYNDFRDTGDSEYTKYIASVLMELQSAIATVKHDGNDEDMASP